MRKHWTICTILSNVRKCPLAFLLVCGVSPAPNIGQNDEPPKKSSKEDVKDDRRHLTPLEVGKLLDATKGSRNEARDRCLLLLMFRHCLRVSEVWG